MFETKPVLTKRGKEAFEELLELLESHGVEIDMSLFHFLTELKESSKNSV